DPLAIAPILDPLACRNQINRLSDVGLQQILGRRQIMLRTQRPQARLTDIAPETSRRVPVAALADIVGLKWIVIGKFPGPWRGEKRIGRWGVVRNPKTIPV